VMSRQDVQVDGLRQLVSASRGGAGGVTPC
jgi:hypothetical protein